jgi:hypothetical protein
MMRAAHRHPGRKRPKRAKKPHVMRARNARYVVRLVN